MNLQDTLQDIREMYGNDWKSYIKEEKEEIQKEVSEKVLQTLSEMNLHDIHENGSYSMDILFLYKEKKIACSYWKDDKSWRFYGLDPSRREQEYLRTLFQAYPFNKMKNKLKAAREAALIEELKAEHIGKVIKDVIDDGNVICVALQTGECYEYNDFLHISGKREKIKYREK